jgi:hypothetical protein
MLIHAQPRQFDCKQCPMKFNRRQHLTRHVKAKHTPNQVIEPEVPAKKAKISTTPEQAHQNPHGLSFFWEPTAQDDVSANLDALMQMAQEAIPEESSVEIEAVATPAPIANIEVHPEESTVEIVPVDVESAIYKHKCGLCTFQHISSVVLAVHQQTRHPTRCCFVCKKVIVVSSRQDLIGVAGGGG